MKCEKARPLILELVMGTIGEGERRDLDLHLKSCDHCGRERAALVDLTASLKSLPLPDPGEEFWKALPIRVEREIARAYNGRGFLRWLRRMLAAGWLFQPGRSAYALASMAIIMIMTVLLFYPRYAVRQGDLMRRGGQETTASLSLPAEDSLGDEGGEGTAGVEDLNLRELDLLYSSLVSSVSQKRADRELIEERTGGIVAADIGSELNDLNPDELKVLSRKLYLMYPEIQEKGVL